MRRVAACLVLAAAIATPGVVVAATSSGHGQALVSEISTGASRPLSPGPVNPQLRPSVDAVKSAFAAEGVDLVVSPIGSQAAEAVQLAPHGRCPIWIIFRRNSHGEDLLPGCTSRGVIERDDLTITYTPASVGSTIRKALAKVSAVAPTTASPYTFEGAIDPSLRPAFTAVLRALRDSGARDLQTLETGSGGAEIMQVEEPGRPCPVHVAFHVVRATDVEMWISNGCADDSIERGDLRIRYSPPSLEPVIRGALATLPG